MISAVALSLLFAVSPAAAKLRHSGRGLQPSGPVDPGTNAYCTYYDEALNLRYDCQYFSGQWGISVQDFEAWNPSVGKDCSNIVVGHSYCVEVNHGDPIPTTTTKPPGATPSPIQDGIAKDCTAFYLVKSGDTCDKISRQYGTFSTADFIKWNPAVGQDCTGLWAKYYYCVGVPGTPTSAPGTTPTTTGTPGPSPTQDGLINTCKVFYKAVKGDTCQKISDKYGTFSIADFVKWNPAVGQDCVGLWADYYYCVGIPGTPTSSPSHTPTPTTPSNGVQTPQPTQPSMVTYCNKFVFINPGDQCGIVAKNSGISLDDLLKWNPAAGKDCTGLWAKSYACVGVLPSFGLTTRYHVDCTGNVFNHVTIQPDSGGQCLNTNCNVGSVVVDDGGICADGEIQVSYWEKPDCSGQWYGYDYTSRGKCLRAWSDGYKFKSLFVKCAKKAENCLSTGTCTTDPEPSNRFC